MEDCATVITPRRLYYESEDLSSSPGGRFPFDPRPKCVRSPMRSALCRIRSLRQPINNQPGEYRRAFRPTGDGSDFVAPDDDWSDVFSQVLASALNPDLGMGRPTVLYAYPVSGAALRLR